MTVKYKPTFVKKYKKLTSQQTQAVNEAVDLLVCSPEIGVQKKGDLSHIWVYKFKFNKQEYLLAYSFNPDTLEFYAVGLHENFYRDLKK